MIATAAPGGNKLVKSGYLTNLVSPAGLFGGNLTNARAESYDGAKSTTRRRTVSSFLMSEDRHLRPADRRKLQANARDEYRNMATVGWAIRRHLDFVASFTFQMKTEDPGLNRDVEQFVAIQSKAQNFDAAGRHNREQWFRLAEAMATVDGDFYAIKNNDRTIQGLESDRIRDPEAGANVRGRLDRKDFTHGLKLDRRGRTRQVAISDRTDRGFKHRTVLPIGVFFTPLAYYQRHDQVRGVSPIASALNDFRDQHEGIELAKAKAKIDQLFGLKVKRNDLTQDEEDESALAGIAKKMAQGPVQIDLDVDGEDAELLTSNNPSSNFQQFMREVVMIALKSLDIPYSFYNESFTNFYGSRGGMIQYIKACKPKRERQVELRDEWTVWSIAGAIRDGVLDIGDRRIGDLSWKWVPAATPIWDMAKEFKGLGMGAAMGIFNLEDLAMEFGATDIYDNIEANARVMEAANDVGVPIVLPDKTAFVPAPGDDNSNSNSGGDDA